VCFLHGTEEMIVRVVVTGGAGFLGSHLCAALLRGGNAVTCIDDLPTGRLPNIERPATGPAG
jgi:dTDP-glucose 4,6-dehydratase